MKRVLYFHGFGSSPQSAKITALRPLLDPHEIELITPDLNVPSFEDLSWQAMAEFAAGQARRIRPRAIAGSSLGALLALDTVRRGWRAPLVLIAPAIGIGDRWESKLPAGDPVILFNHARNADAPIHRRFFQELSMLHVDDEPPPVTVAVIMGKKDETVPFDVVEDRWSEWERAGLVAGSKLIDLEDGDHSLTKYVDLIAREIIAACT